MTTTGQAIATAEEEATTPAHQDRLDDRLEPRVRMLEELARGQARQLTMLVTNDERRIAIDQQNAVVISRLADALSNVEKSTNDNRSLILDKVDDKFKMIVQEAAAVERRLTQNMEGVSSRIDSLDTRLSDCEGAISDQGRQLSDHGTFKRAVLWCAGAGWAILVAFCIAMLNHWIGHWK